MEAAYLLGTGGAIGALCRYWIGEAVGVEEFPIATLFVNGLGSLVLGLVTFGGAGSDTVLFVGVGACGSFTTYSSFSFQTVQLWESGKRGYAAGNAVSNLVLSLLALAVAWLVVRVV